MYFFLNSNSDIFKYFLRALHDKVGWRDLFKTKLKKIPWQ